MNKLLHIIATPRGEDSRTLKIARSFLENFKKKYPSCIIEEINLFKEPLQDLTVKIVSGKYVLLGGKDLSGELKSSWENVLREIERFLSADGYLISTPMWNFSIPYVLKHYIDIILQPKYLFRYTAAGVEGLAKNKKMIVVTSRGGEYGAGSPMKAYDYQEPYLRTAFGFIGIKDISFIIAQPMDMDPKIGAVKLEEAISSARHAASAF